MFGFCVQVSDVSTVEGFWQVINNVQNPEGMSQGCTYHLFKVSIFFSFL